MGGARAKGPGARDFISADAEEAGGPDLKLKAEEVYRERFPELAKRFRGSASKEDLDTVYCEFKKVVKEPWIEKVSPKPRRFRSH